MVLREAIQQKDSEVQIKIRQLCAISVTATFKSPAHSSVYHCVLLCVRHMLRGCFNPIFFITDWTVFDGNIWRLPPNWRQRDPLFSWCRVHIINSYCLVPSFLSCSHRPIIDIVDKGGGEKRCSGEGQATDTDNIYQPATANVTREVLLRHTAWTWKVADYDENSRPCQSKRRTRESLIHVKYVCWGTSLTWAGVQCTASVVQSKRWPTLWSQCQCGTACSSCPILPGLVWLLLCSANCKDGSLV